MQTLTTISILLSVFALEILSTITTLIEKEPSYSERFGDQAIDCITTHKSVEEWLMSRVIRDFGGKDKLGNLIQVESCTVATI